MSESTPWRSFVSGTLSSELSILLCLEKFKMFSLLKTASVTIQFIVHSKSVHSKSQTNLFFKHIVVADALVQATKRANLMHYPTADRQNHQRVLGL